MINKTTVIMAVIIAVLTMILIYSNQQNHSLKDSIKTASADATYWRDEHGRSNAEAEVHKAHALDLEKLADSLKAIDIKPRTVTKIETVVIESVDTITVSRGRPYADKWRMFNFISDSSLAYSFKDSIALITHTKRYGFLNRKKMYVTRALSYNPHTLLTGITSKEIMPKERRVTLGLYAGYGLQFNSGLVRTGWSTGIGVTFRVF